MKDVEITIKFKHEFDKETDSSIYIYVDGHEQDINTLDDDIKMRCISQLDKWYDILYDDLMK